MIAELMQAVRLRFFRGWMFHDVLFTSDRIKDKQPYGFKCCNRTAQAESALT